MKKQYTQDDLVLRLKQLAGELGREPTWLDIQVCPYLPTTRALQRSYGGLKALRSLAGLDPDHTKGRARVGELNRFIEHSANLEKELVDRLRQTHGFLAVHEQFYFSDDRRKRSDCAVLHESKKHIDVYDIFNPKDQYSFHGCILSKSKKYSLINLGDPFLQSWTYKVYFVCGNPSFTQDKIDALLKNKKTPLPPHTVVIPFASV